MKQESGDRHALKVNGKIFAMISSKGEFVVKLPAKRVLELIGAGMGEAFDPGRGRAMKQWLVVEAGHRHWRQLAIEARTFVGRRKLGESQGASSARTDSLDGSSRSEIAA